MADASVIEKPPKTGQAAKTTEYVVVVDNATGIPIKVEKINEATGQRHELSQAEYGQLFGYAGTSFTPLTAAFSIGGAPADPSAIVQAYYKGIADYLNAIAGLK